MTPVINHLKDNQCPHPADRLHTYTTGGTHFSGGVVWDDVKFHTICLKCGAELEEPEVDWKQVDTGEQIPI